MKKLLKQLWRNTPMYFALLFTIIASMDAQKHNWAPAQFEMLFAILLVGLQVWEEVKAKSKT